MHIRSVDITDAASLVDIYAPYVEKTAITFEYEVPSAAEFENRIRTVSAGYPYLAAEENGSLLGYAYASAFKVRPAYAWSAETSIYVREASRGRGVGRALYTCLEEILKRQNICNLCACITYPNPESVFFHENFGYKTVAHFTSSGYKLGKWHDIIWMEKSIREHADTPQPFIPINRL